MLIVFNDDIADMKSNKKSKSNSHLIFVKRKKTHYFAGFISQSYFKMPRTIRINTTHDFIMKTFNERQLQHIASNHSSDIGFEDFMKRSKDYPKESYLFSVSDTTLSSDNPLRFKKNWVLVSITNSGTWAVLREKR